jgi:hypothetical protein
MNLVKQRFTVLQSNFTSIIMVSNRTKITYPYYFKAILVVSKHNEDVSENNPRIYLYIY